MSEGEREMKGGRKRGGNGGSEGEREMKGGRERGGEREREGGREGWRER